MKTAMILAAGRGERLRPVTDQVPKALCQVKGKPLIEYHVEKLANKGFERVIINHAHLGGQIRHYLGNGNHWNIEICYAPEPIGGLETGGGIYNALPLLGHEPFLTVNADIYTDYDFSMLVLPQNTLVNLILVTNPNHNVGDFGLTKEGLLTNEHIYTFAGIACYHPAVFEGCRPGRYSVTPLLRNLANQQLAAGEIFSGLWLDIGTLERLELANRSD